MFTILYSTIIRYLNVKHSERETTQRYYNQRISLLLEYISFLIRTLQMALDPLKYVRYNHVEYGCADMRDSSFSVV